MLSKNEAAKILGWSTEPTQAQRSLSREEAEAKLDGINVTRRTGYLRNRKASPSGSVAWKVFLEMRKEKS